MLLRQPPSLDAWGGGGFRVSGEWRPGSLLIIDDILTTGTTGRMIITALRQYSQTNNIQLFTLAKATLDTSGNQSAALQGQHYRLEEGTAWQVAEEQAPYEYSLKRLKTWIRSDIF